MVYGIDVDEELTKTLVNSGFWKPGVLIEFSDQLWILIGYTAWGWLDSYDDEKLFYEAILVHIGSGITTSFPLLKLENEAKCIKTISKKEGDSDK